MAIVAALLAGACQTSAPIAIDHTLFYELRWEGLADELSREETAYSAWCAGAQYRLRCLVQWPPRDNSEVFSADLSRRLDEIQVLANDVWAVRPPDLFGPAHQSLKLKVASYRLRFDGFVDLLQEWKTAAGNQVAQMVENGMLSRPEARQTFEEGFRVEFLPRLADSAMVWQRDRLPYLKNENALRARQMSAAMRQRRAELFLSDVQVDMPKKTPPTMIGVGSSDWNLSAAV